ncbi:Tubby-like F-box protein [Actinidia chinensis var. chinensis]|uniref:Tubby-like F-box protein n=1 Tax=Actinidia chinensis var. chinensis TaxID=1590841 RepID=A0A2R6PGG0_ACTCC|nr:Tubby-like F-box protein [Actinidia chinensis var. chinensis]
MKEAKSAGPWIVAMKGHPGTGKSTLAKSLASSLNCPLLDKDDVRDATSTLQLSISPKFLNELSYDVVWRLASTQIRLGLSVVIDSPLSRRPYLNRLLELAADAGARLVIVECKSNDEDEWRRRLERRGAAEGASWHKPTTWRDLEKLLEEYGGCTQYDIGDVPKLVLDTTAPVGIKEHVSAVLRFIDSCCSLG